MVLLTGMVSCKKDHDIPTGKTFNEGSGGGGSTASYTVSVSADPSNGGTVSGGGEYQKGQICVVAASANEGYVFNHWTENGNQVSNNVSYSFTVTEDRNLVANFATSSGNYTITAMASPIEGGTVSGGGTYMQGQTCTVTAIANEDYTFTNWTENDTQVSSDANYSFTVTGNRTLTAHFSANTGDVTSFVGHYEGNVLANGNTEVIINGFEPTQNEFVDREVLISLDLIEGGNMNEVFGTCKIDDREINCKGTVDGDTITFEAINDIVTLNYNMNGFNISPQVDMTYKVTGILMNGQLVLDGTIEGLGEIQIIVYSGNIITNGTIDGALNKIH